MTRSYHNILAMNEKSDSHRKSLPSPPSLIPLDYIRPNGNSNSTSSIDILTTDLFKLSILCDIYDEDADERATSANIS